MTIVVASYARAVMPGVNSFFGAGYNELPLQWKEIFDSYTSDMNFEEDVNTYGLGLMQIKPEAEAIKYDDMGQAWSIYYKHITYALGYIISREAIEDNKYEQLAYARAKSLGMAARQTQENVGAMFLNRAFDANYAQADGQPVCSTANKLSKGGTFSNTQAAAADLSEAALENALIQIQTMVNDASLRVEIKGQKLIVPPQLEFEAERLLGNVTWRPGTANRDIPAMAYLGKLPQGFVINNYLSDADAYFIKTNCPDGLKHFERRAMEIVNDTPDFDTDNMRFKCSYRDSFGITDKRAIWGSPGA